MEIILQYLCFTGYYTEGSTKEEALRIIKDAIKLHIEETDA